MNRLIVFDLDGTLTNSKVAVSPDMSRLITKLLDCYPVAVISGQPIAGFRQQLIDLLPATPNQFANLHILPTNGTNYYKYDLDTHKWMQIFAEEIPAAERDRVYKIIEHTARQLDFWPQKSWGPVIEDRISQLTFSGLGQSAPIGPKSEWDPDGSKKRRLQQALAHELPGYNVHSAGLTSVDVTPLGLDKATAIDKLKEILGFSKEAVIYVGDALAPGGNDAVVAGAGYYTIGVSGPDETAAQIKELISGCEQN